MHSFGPLGQRPDTTLERAHSELPPAQSQLLDRPASAALGGIDARQAWQVLRQRQRFVYSVAAVVFAGVMGFTLLSGMQFQATGRLYLGELDDKPQTRKTDEDFLGGERGDVYSEIEIVRSRSLVEQAVLGSGLNVRINPEGEGPLRYWRWRLSRRDPALLDVSASALDAAQTVPRSRLQETQVVNVRFRDRTHYGVWSEDGLHLGDGQLGVPCDVGSVHLVLAAGARGGPQPTAAYELKIEPLEETLLDVEKNLQVSAAKVATATEPVKVLTLEFTNPSPERAAAFLKRLIEGYLRARQSWKTEDASAAEVFVSVQLEEIKRSLDASQRKLAEFRANHPAVVQSSQANSVVEQLANFQQQRLHAHLQENSFREIQQALRQPTPALEAFLVGETPMGEIQDSVLKGIAENLLDAQRTLADLSGRVYEDAPAVVLARARVATQLETARGYVATRLARAQEQVRVLNGVIEQYEAKLQAVPGAELGLAAIERESEVYSRMYTYLLERQQQTQILKASTISKNRILDAPRPPVRESSPKLALRAASALLGLLLGAILVIAQSLWSSALRSEIEVRLLARSPVIASIPTQPPLPGAARPGAAPLFDLLARSGEAVGFAEAFRTLRTNLYDAQPPGAGVVVLVTSPAPADGKTTTALSLASILAADRKQVLVIDADVRKPSHHRLTGHEPQPGLCEWLELERESEHEIDPATHMRAVHVTGGSFDALSAGIAAPIELLSDPALPRLLLRLRERYDYILVDSPSFPLVSDALMLTKHADLVVSVVRLGRTPRKVAEQHIATLAGKSSAHALVINGSDVAASYGQLDYARVAGAVAAASASPTKSRLQ
jgi:tyrosine-protein kinase Etk/Wzc